jgi:alkanesulfonate monooxygenase
MTATFYTAVPRMRDLNGAAQTALDVVRWSDENNFDGVLFFTGSGAVLDPWVIATASIASSSRLIPLIAVNPVYVHPFAAARMVASIAHIYGRAVSLNLITGTAVSDLVAIGDGIEHDDRYDRLLEYATIMRELLTSPRPLQYKGRFYTISRAQLTPRIPAELLPKLFIAGQSAAALMVAEQMSAISIGMLPPTLAARSPAVEAQHFGVVTRATTTLAWEAARRYFPTDQIGAEVVRASMANTDSTWKRRLMAIEESDRPIYWTSPFRSGQADCPYIVASHGEFAELITDLTAAGTGIFVLDIPPQEEDFCNVAEAIRLTRQVEATP